MPLLFLYVDNYNQNIAYFITILTTENKELELNVQKSTVEESQIQGIDVKPMFLLVAIIWLLLVGV